MQPQSLIVAFFIIFGLFGCSNNEDEHKYASPQQLKQAYQEFQTSKNLEGLLSLVYSKNKKNDLHLMSFEDDIKYQVDSITIENLKTGDLDEWKARGFEPNIDPVGWLKITFKHTDAQKPGMSYFSTSQYLIGKKGSGYYIATNN